MSTLAMVSPPVTASVIGILIGALIIVSSYILWQMHTIANMGADIRRLRKLADTDEALIENLEREKSATAAELAVAVAARVEAENQLDLLAARLVVENQRTSDHDAQTRALEYGTALSAQDPPPYGLPHGRLLRSI